MPYARLVKSGCGIHKDRVKLRIDLFLDADDPYYTEHGQVWDINYNSPEWLAGYKGEVVDEEGTPDPVKYQEWVNTLPHLWKIKAFHHHFIYPDLDATDEVIKTEIQRVLDYFYAFDTRCWSNSLKFKDEWGKVHKRPGEVKCPFVKGEAKDLEVNKTRVADIVSRIVDFETGKREIPDVDLKIGEKGTIDVGSNAENRSSAANMHTYTRIDYNNAANEDGSLDTVEAYFATVTADNSFRVGTFHDNSSASFTCHAAYEIGEIDAVGYQIYTGLDIDILTGEFIGADTAGESPRLAIDRDLSGYSGVYYKAGAQCVADNTQTYDLYSEDCISLEGSGAGGVDVTIDAPVVAVDGAAIIPSLSLGLVIPAPYVAIDSEVLTPTWCLEALILPPAVSIDSQVFIPTLSLDRIFSAPLVSIDSAILTPSLALDSIFGAPLVAIAGDILTPILSLGLTVVSPLVTIDSQALVPTLLRDRIFAAPVVAIDATALTPSLSLGLVLVAPIVAIDTEALPATFSLSIILLPPAALIDVAALIPWPWATKAPKRTLARARLQNALRNLASSRELPV